MPKVVSLPGKAAAASGSAPPLSAVVDLLDELRAGRMVVVMDDEDRENEGDLIMAAEHATPEAVAFMIRYTSGIICVPMEEEQLARLELPQMVPVNSESHRTAFAVSVDLRAGTTTGVSSGDRAATIRALADAASTAADFARPGHIFPLRSRRGGVLVRAGHTEAAVDLCRLAGLKPAGVLCEVMNDDGSMARRPQLQDFARRHQLKVGTIADLIRHRLRIERSVERISEQSVHTEHGEFRLYAYRDCASLEVHLALAHGRLDGPQVPLVRVHLPDTLRDLCGVRGTARAWTLRAAMRRIVEAGNGVVVVLRSQETAHELADAVRSLAAAPATAPAAEAAGSGGEGAVLRTFGVGAQILKDLGVRRMRVLSAPKQMLGISAFDLEIEGYVGEEGVTQGQLIEAELSGRGRKIAIVAARFNDFIVASLLKGASAAWSAHGGAPQDLTVVRVPGAFELPVAAKKLAASGRFEALVALGCVIRGDTPHFDYIAGECARGLQQASLESGLPIAFGVLTVENREQALERAAVGGMNKGGEAMECALEMAALMARL